jgi:hypothetical protein
VTASEGFLIVSILLGTATVFPIMHNILLARFIKSEVQRIEADIKRARAAVRTPLG